MKDVRLENGDRQSDISDNATQESADDIREYDSEFEEKFRVDRKKLELMLQSVNEDENAERFFQRVMDETNTLISWPSKLKIGAKSKKDPHIKLTGHPDAIREAKVKVKAVLDTRNDIVSLKMDVSHTDHSHVIGRRGSNIQRVVKETGCHIHFPDSNRNNTLEKSNQVTINGQLHGVEQSRAFIRGMLPLVFMFELPVSVVLQPLPERGSPFIQDLQNLFDVQVYFKPQPRCPLTVIVRGSESWASKVKDGTRRLLEHLVGSAGVFVKVMMTIEITAQHHVKLKEACQSIMKNTGTCITFPDVSASGPAILKSRVVVAGSVENVHLARQQIMEFLPLVLIFDLNEDQDVDHELISRLMHQLDVSIYAKQKIKKCGITITVKGLEKDARNLYEARRLLLGLEEYEVPVILTKICPTPSPVCSSNGHLGSEVGDIGLQNRNILNVNVANTLFHSPLASPSLPLQPAVGMSTGGWSTSSTFSGYYPMPHYNFHIPNHATMPAPSDVFHVLNKFNNRCVAQEPGYCSAPSSTTSSLSSPSHSPRRGGSPVEASSLSTCDCGSSTESKSANDSVMDLLKRQGSDALKNPTVMTPGKCNSSETESFISDRPPKDQQLVHRKAPGCELQNISTLSFPSDYENKQLMASKAMRKKPEEPEVRIPNSFWSGYGFSQSLPESAQRLLRQECPSFEQNGSPSTEDIKARNIDKDPWKDSPTNRLPSSDQVNALARRTDIDLGSSNYIDSASLPLCSSSFIGKCTQLADLFNTLRLSKYIQLFQQQEIDLVTFLSMTDQDLKDLGITTFGARRKMLLAISSLKEQPSAFYAAPGAERKFTSTLNGGPKADRSPTSSFW